MAYYPHIDGLRALAVLGVILYHGHFSFYQWRLFPGGYLGVDVFFVISGYLMTRLIRREMENENFSLRRFYARRAFRLLPALFLMMALLTPFAWYYLPPRELERFGEGIFASLFLVSNILFSRGEGYFDYGPNLLLHTWSLSVEEQFCLGIPFLFLFLSTRKSLLLPFAMGALLIGSLAFATYCSLQYSTESYFFLSCRLWEFLLGGLITFLPERRYPGRFPTVLALLCLILSFCLFQKTLPHPSLWTLIPTLGSALLIRYGDRGGWESRWLSSKMLVGCGLMSYSLYLWHVPIFSFLEISLDSPPSQLQRLSAMAMVFPLAWVCWRFVERPLRKGYLFPSPRYYQGLGMVGLCLLLIGVSSQRNEEFRNPYGRLGFQNAGTRENEEKFSAGSQGPWVLIGDSHALMYRRSLQKELKKRNLSLLNLATSGCPYILGFEHRRGVHVEKKCAEFNERTREELRSLGPTTLLLAMNMPLYLEGTRFKNDKGFVAGGEEVEFFPVGRNPGEGLRRSELTQSFVDGVQELLSWGHRIVLFYPVPEVGWNIPQAMLRRAHIRDESVLSVDYSWVMERQKESRRIYDSLGLRSEILRVYPDRIFCDTFLKDRCVTQKKPEVFYSDSNHLSLAGTDRVVAKLFHSLGAPRLP